MGAPHCSYYRSFPPFPTFSTRLRIIEWGYHPFFIGIFHEISQPFWKSRKTRKRGKAEKQKQGSKKRKSRETEKQRSRKAEKQGIKEAEKQNSKEAEKQSKARNQELKKKQNGKNK